ncbi:MAG TPA: alpha/beta hydrolase [Streptosporangiaceae bacterium]
MTERPTTDVPAGGGWPPQFQQAGATRREWDHLRRLAAVAGLDHERLIIPSHGYADVGGLSLHYVQWPGPEPGPEPGPGAGDLLFLHGGALQARTWDAVCMFLRDTYRCTALDLRGHGDSDWSPDHDYDLATHAADVARFIGQRGLDRVTLIGHSLGGLTSILVAATQASRATQASPAMRADVAGLVLVDMLPSANRQATGRVRDFIRSRQEFGSADELLDHVLQFAPRRRQDLLAGSLMHNIQVRADGTLAWKYDPSHFSTDPVETHGDALWASIAEITCPILLVRGGRSRVVTSESAERLLTQARHARVRSIERAGHTVQGDAPGELAAAIREFTDDDDWQARP